jgi:hypothetical protein
MGGRRHGARVARRERRRQKRQPWRPDDPHPHARTPRPVADGDRVLRVLTRIGTEKETKREHLQEQ